MENLYRTAEAAEFLRRSRRTLETWRVAGGGPTYIKAGGIVLYGESALRAWLDGNTRTSTSDTGTATAAG